MKRISLFSYYIYSYTYSIWGRSFKLCNTFFQEPLKLVKILYFVFLCSQFSFLCSSKITTVTKTKTGTVRTITHRIKQISQLLQQYRNPSVFRSQHRKMSHQQRVQLLKKKLNLMSSSGSGSRNSIVGRQLI